MTYHAFMKASLPAFTISRIIPWFGVSLALSLIAHRSPSDLAVFSYVLALFSVVSALLPMLLATSGNVTSSLSHNETARCDFFTAGFTIALFIAVISGLLCLGVFLCALNLSSMRNIDMQSLKILSLIYIPAVPLLSLNLFLQLFHEASGKSSECSRIKTFVTLVGTLGLLIMYECSTSELFTYGAMAYFLVTELAVLICLLKLSRPYKHFSFREAKNTASSLLAQGIPIAIGLGGQKLYFYLTIERLATTNTTLVAQFSLFMSIIGIVTIPALALSQIHSLHTSQHAAGSAENYRFGLSWLAGLVMGISFLLFFTGRALFTFISGAVINYTPGFYSAAVFFLATSAFSGLALAHLRARNDTSTPQFIINMLMLGGVIPLVYGISWQDQSVTTLINLQGAAMLMGFLILHRRVLKIHRGDKITRSHAH
ncbi:hypothetical protein [Pseudomonas sp. DSP3-2-2]|uniref:hypothetical protein n=1 Tax=unclassified Pseudomonas TaxID=196821 RepID=UPI003CEE749C